ncbi:hypothetical protein FO519_008471 [Halicephalobus sp. NKZ332]|nr:hypothetical protein FO519_008471 [Halicephalobus sp. NKZ332]
MTSLENETVFDDVDILETTQQMPFRAQVIGGNVSHILRKITFEIIKVNDYLELGENILFGVIIFLVFVIILQVVFLIRLWLWNILKTRIVEEMEFEENCRRRIRQKEYILGNLETPVEQQNILRMYPEGLEEFTTQLMTFNSKMAVTMVYVKFIIILSIIMLILASIIGIMIIYFKLDRKPPGQLEHQPLQPPLVVKILHPHPRRFHGYHHIYPHRDLHLTTAGQQKKKQTIQGTPNSR